MYCIQYDEICKKHNFELKHDALGERVTLEYPADSVPKDTIRLFQNHLPEGVSAMAEKYSSDRFCHIQVQCCSGSREHHRSY